jgi:hypothetical protein
MFQVQTIDAIEDDLSSVEAAWVLDEVTTSRYHHYSPPVYYIGPSLLEIGQLSSWHFFDDSFDSS